MANLKTKMTVGLFVAIGMVIAIIAIIWLGMSNYLLEGMYYAAYFDESVQGLDKDSPVKYRGLSIGRVHSISVAQDANLIEVILKIESEQQIEEALTVDLVARLKSVGITGIMFIELERKRPGELDFTPTLSFKSKYPVVATRPSEIQKLMKGVNNVINQIQALDIQGITERIKATLDSVNQAVDDVQIKQISENIQSILKKTESVLETKDWGELIASYEKAGATLNEILANASKTMNRLDLLVAKNEQGITESINRFRSSMTTAEATFSRIDRMVAENEKGFRETIDSIQYSMRTAVTTLERLDRFVADNEPAVQEAIDKLKTGMNTADLTLKRLDGIVAQNETAINQVIANFNQTMKTAHTTLAKVDKVISDNETEIGSAIRGFNRSMKSADSALTQFEGMVSGNETVVKEALVSFKKAMVNAEDFMDRGRSLIENSEQKLSNLQRHLIVMLQNLEKATDNLNRFVESIADRPSQLIFGQPPPSQRFEPERFE